MTLRLAALALAGALSTCAGAPAMAHDIYTGIHGDDGQLCCGLGDCEPVEFREERGRLRFHSTRHNAWISVRYDQVTYRVLEGDHREGVQRAHWCGYRRVPVTGAQAPMHGDDPDYGTYCALVEPGGS